jgi:hypothetical protein
MGGANYRKSGAQPATPPKILTITGFIFMGGVDVKH